MTSPLDFAHLFSQFKTQGRFLNAKPFGTGHINDTFLVQTESSNTHDYIFQRINHMVFTNLDKLMDNIAYVTDHIQKRLVASGDAYPERHCLTVVKTREGATYLKDEYEHCWVVYLFIRGKTHDIVTSPAMAFEGGKMYGRFIDLLSNIDTSRLHETIPDFHNINLRLQQFEHALMSNSANRAQELTEDIAYIRAMSEPMKTIFNLGEAGKIPKRVTHNDTKFNNVLLDEHQQGLCVIDLDTVMPGYIHYDYSDAIRTATNTAVEDEADLEKVDIDLHLLKGFCKGFINEIKNDATPMELSTLPLSTSLLPYLIGVRFLTDYLNGDIYFKTNYKNQNLIRARCQLQLVRRIEIKMPQIETMIERIIDEKKRVSV
jgi:Ser/Thr protein kinase RdoA (MazF antagonist)